MKLFEGKSKTERNKIIAAAVLGLMCLVVFYFAFLRGSFGSGPATAAVKPSPSPKVSTSGAADPQARKIPSQAEQDLYAQTTPIDYRPGIFGAPDPGRNIFAFYEPPPPCRENCPTPLPPPVVIITPTPAPTPHFQIALLNPQSLYAGSKGFRLEVAGDNFTPDARIYFNQQEMPTTFVSSQKLTADIPGVLLTSEGQKQVLAQSGDGTLYSNPVMLDVQPAPKPQVQYIGMIARKRSNNDTAYFLESGKQIPMAARLNDVVEGRFRLLSISAQETVLEDVNLGFKHRLKLFEPPPGTQPAQPGGGRPTFPTRESYVPFTPPAPAGTANGRIPGIPDNVPRYIPPASNTNRPVANKPDIDDNDDNRKRQ